MYSYAFPDSDPLIWVHCAKEQRNKQSKQMWPTTKQRNQFQTEKKKEEKKEDVICMCLK